MTQAMADECVVRLDYEPPYDWAALRDFLATRIVPGVECIEADGYVRTLRGSHGVIVAAVRPLPGEHALELRVRGASAPERSLLEQQARRVFDVNANPRTIAAAFRDDELLGPLLARRPGLRIPGAWDPFECAVRAVLGQQVSVAAARTLAARVVARAGERIDAGHAALTHLFPSPAALARADLDGLGVTGARIRALKSLSCALEDGALSFALSSAEFTTRLASLPGFGAWTAQYIALRALADRDAFPTGDLVLRRMAGGAAPLASRELTDRAQRWRPWRAYAVMHLWRAAVDGGAGVLDSRSARAREQHSVLAKRRV